MCDLIVPGSSHSLAMLNPRQNHRRGLTFQCPPRPRAPCQVPSACGSLDAPLAPVSLGGTCPSTQPAPWGSPCYPEWSGSSGPRASGGPCGSSRSEEGPPWSRPGSFLTKHSLTAWGVGVVPNIHAFQPLFWASGSAWLSASVTSIRFKGKACQWSVQPQTRTSASPQGPAVCVRALMWSSQPQRLRDRPQQSRLLSSLRGSAGSPGKRPRVCLSLLTIVSQ